MATYPSLPQPIQQFILDGQVIPAHPLALDSQRRFDERYQRALTRYYLDSGSGGVAVGVHTTQFAIRDPEFGLFEPVLRLARDTIDEYNTRHPDRTIIRVAGICGKTPQAVKEAELARTLKYQVGLLSLGALRDASEDQLIQHAQAVAQVIPLMGFYLQPSVGGRILDYTFWRRFCEIPNVVAIKIAPFNRYQTLDVIRAVAASGRENEIALYTGNDDNIVFDLLSRFEIPIDGTVKSLWIVGGLLGHWAFWTRRAVELLQKIKNIQKQQQSIAENVTALAWQITDANTAAFDPTHQFAGCISGIHEILIRQGLLRSPHCLDPNERLSPGQAEEINRIQQSYPHLCDDEFVKENLDRWLKD